MRKIAIIGAGNVGTAMLSMLSQNEELSVTMYTTKKNLWGKDIKYKNMSLNSAWCNAGSFNVTDSLAEAVNGAEQVFVTLPSFLREKFVDDIYKCISPNTLIAFIPGCGGIEFFCRKLINKGCSIIGFERVPAVSRIIEYGQSVEFEWKKSLRVSGLNVEHNRMISICDILSKEFRMEFVPLANYLSVTLTPANPIMHPVRLYSMFKNKKKDSVIDHDILFYGE